MSLNLIAPIDVLKNVDMTASKTSAGIHVLYSDNIGIQFVWTGTPTGTFGLNVSNTARLNTDGTVSGGTWTPLAFSSAPAATGAAGNGYIEFGPTAAAFIQVTYTAVSGTGTCTATLTAKPI